MTGNSENTPTTVYYHIVALGSTRPVISSTRSVVFTDRYQAYGQDNSASGTDTCRFTNKHVSQHILMTASPVSHLPDTLDANIVKYSAAG
ncbi:MAG: hypothetical protein AUG17_08075 [Crenarchaeota archaeon 13_1_20CM_2_53_14]|nr:MAG: hypothetical protein AUG17_08075 [Crenarchaeota archaeon 13_1_20CM_2_53_14]